RALNDHVGVGYSLLALGLYSFSQGDYLTARARYREGLPVLIDVGDRWFIAVGLEELAAASTAQGTIGGSRADVLWAAKLWGAAEMLRETIGSPVPSFQRDINEQGIASTRTYLGEEAFAAAWAEGRTMTP